MEVKGHLTDISFKLWKHFKHDIYLKKGIMAISLIYSSMQLCMKSLCMQSFLLCSTLQFWPNILLQHFRDQGQEDFAAKLKREEKNLKKGLIIPQERDQTLGSTNSIIDGLIKDYSQLVKDIDFMWKELLRRERKVHLIKVRCDDSVRNFQSCVVERDSEVIHW